MYMYSDLVTVKPLYLWTPEKHININVPTREVPLFQRLICTYTVETSETVLIREVSLLQRYP